MFVLRCTRKLLARLPRTVTSAGQDSASSTRLGDWTARLVFVGHQQIVLAANSTTLLPVLLPIAPNKTLIARFVEAAGEVMMALGIDRQAVLAEMAAMNDCVVAPTNNRSVLGTLNDFGRALTFYVGRPLPEVTLILAETPCSPIGMASPRHATRALFEQDGARVPSLRLVKG